MKIDMKIISVSRILRLQATLLSTQPFAPIYINYQLKIVQEILIADAGSTAISQN